MDKYARQSHKTYQHARRRNNTAEHVLDNRLKQLDKDLRSRQILYLRNKKRVTRELVNLESISSDFDLLQNNKSKKEHYDWNKKKLDYNSNHKVDGRDIKTERHSLSTTTEKCINFPETVSSLSLSSMASPRKNSSDKELPVTFPNGVVTSTPLDSLPNSRRNSGKRRPRNNRNVNLGSCEYNHFNLRMPNTCNHFPCKSPSTYHTIGFRREDLCPRTDDLSNLDTNTNGKENSEETITSIFPRKENCLTKNKITANEMDNKSGSCPNISQAVAFNTNWIKRKEKPKHPFEYRPTIHGPVFGFTPTDPVLERIRAHRVEPKLNATRPCARVTIRDRIRGVKQLVKEMKLSVQKPDDWATNYGKRVPTRVLLNPVVPV